MAERAIRRIADGRNTLLISRAILDELLGVLSRKFARETEELARVALLLDELGELVTPRMRIGILRDDPDNRILECALAGGAEIIVTGDRAMLARRKVAECRILPLRAYLAEP